MSTPVKLTADDFKKKNFKVAPGGTYFVRILKSKTKIEKKTKGKQLTVYAKIMKGSSKGITFFDNISATVGWKIAQLLVALGIKKPKKGLTLEGVLKMILNKDLRAQLKIDNWQGKKRNKVVTWLPLKKAKDEDDDEDTEDPEDEDSDEDEDEEDSDGDDDEDSDDEDSDDDSDDDDDEDSDDDDDEDSDDDDDDSSDDDDDDEEEVEVKPRRKKGSKKKPVAKKKAKKSSDDDEDEDE